MPVCQAWGAQVHCDLLAWTPGYPQTSSHRAHGQPHQAHHLYLGSTRPRQMAALPARS